VRDKLLTDARDTLLAFNGSAFAVRFSSSAIFFISEVALLWKKKDAYEPRLALARHG